MTRRALLACGLGAVVSLTESAGADTFSITVEAGRLVVDGRWVEAPFPIVYTTSPPGVSVASIPLLDDAAAVGELLAFSATPDTVQLARSSALDGRRRVPPVEPAAREVLKRLAARIGTFVLEQARAGPAPADLEQALGRFLLQSPEVVAAELDETVVRIEVSLEDEWALELPPPDGATLERLSVHVQRRLEEAREAARLGAVYEDGERHAVGEEPARDLIEALLLAGTAEGAAPWLARAWGGAIGADVAARAIHAHLAATGVAGATAALASDYPRGAEGAWILADARGRLALACRDVDLSRLSTRLDREAGVELEVPYVDRERRVTFFSAAFRPPAELVAELAEANALAMTRTGEAFEVREGFRGDLERIPREGQSLWRTGALHVAARWLTTTTSRLLAPVRLGGVRALRWRTGGVAWQLTGSHVPYAPRAGAGDRLYVADAAGAVSRVAYADGRADWSVYPALPTPTLAPRAVLRPVDATPERARFIEDDAWLVELDVDTGRLVRRVPLDASGGVSLLSTGERVALDDDVWVTARGTWLAVADGSGTGLAEVPLGPSGVWAAADDALLAGGEGATARLYRAGAWAEPEEVLLPAVPRVAFATDGALYVACSDGHAYRIDVDRARVAARLEGVDIPAGTPVAVHGIAVFHGTYGGGLAGYRVR